MFAYSASVKRLQDLQWWAGYLQPRPDLVLPMRLPPDMAFLRRDWVSPSQVTLELDLMNPGSISWLQLGQGLMPSGDSKGGA